MVSDGFSSSESVPALGSAEVLALGKCKVLRSWGPWQKSLSQHGKARQSTAKHAKHGYVVPRGYTQRAGKARVFRLMIYLYDPVWWVFCIFMFAGR